MTTRTNFIITKALTEATKVSPTGSIITALLKANIAEMQNACNDGVYC